MGRAHSQGCIGVISFADAKINKYSSGAYLWHNDVGWFDVSVDNRKLLTMQVVNSLDDGAHDGHGVGPGKPLFRLLLPQCVQIWPFYILHQYVYPSVPVIIEHFIDMRESFVRRLPEQYIFEDESMSLLFIEVDYLLKNEELVLSIFDMLISDQVDSARGPFAE